MKVMTALRLDDGLVKAMRDYKTREGVPISVQIELAVTDWLERKGVRVKTERTRAVPRTRPSARKQR
jgi:hypothetical protein